MLLVEEFLVYLNYISEFLVLIFHCLLSNLYIHNQTQQEMWYLNYCSPFLFNSNTPNMIYRYIMYSEIFALFILYIIFLIAYRFFSNQQTEPPKFANQSADTLLTGSRLTCTSSQNWISSKKFKEWYLSYFGMHAVSVGICIFYSPYFPQMIFTLVHFGLWIFALVFFFCRKAKSKVIKYAYNAIMALVCVLNVMLLFSGSMGVGASGYDQNAKICLLQSQSAGEL